MIKKKLSVLLVASFLSSTAWSSDHSLDDIDVDSLLGMSIDQLQSVKVTSVSKKPENPFEAAAAIYVLTSDDIRRMGATSIPEALRVVPGLEVSKMDANKWAVTARGFNSQFSNKLLVLVDGRTVYTPLFSGVYWDVQDMILEDIARIEVIRGPGATLWGANAVNGIINIITKSAKNTQGTYLSGIVGNEDRMIGESRYGGTIGKDVYYRMYAKHAKRDASETLTGEDAGDEWKTSRTGFRVDWDKDSSNTFAVHGDVYSGVARQEYTLPTGVNTSDIIDGDEQVRGGNVVGKWDTIFSNGSVGTFQMYFDHIQRNINILNQRRSTIDLDFQHAWDLNSRNEVVWGLNYRYYQDDLDERTIGGVKYLDYTPDNSDNNLYSAFVQDKIALKKDKLYLTLGSKFEHHYTTDWEIQPNARLTWLASDKQTLWAAVSHAARTPTRGESGLVLVGIPGVVNTVGNESYESERLTAYEIGHRIQPNWRLSFDTTAFFNDYDDLRVFVSDGGANIITQNGGHGEAYGIEVASRFSPTQNWNLYANYSYITLDLHLDPGVSERFPLLEPFENTSPKHRFNVLSRINLTSNLEFDMNVMYTDNVSNFDIPAYIRTDARLGWKPTQNVELSVVGQNLFDDTHTEFDGSLFAADKQIERSFYGRVTIRF